METRSGNNRTQANDGWAQAGGTLMAWIRRRARNIRHMISLVHEQPFWQNLNTRSERLRSPAPGQKLL